MQNDASITPSVFTSTTAYRSGSVAVSTPCMYDVMGRDITPIWYYGSHEGASIAGRQEESILTADKYLSQCDRAGVAQTPIRHHRCRTTHQSSGPPGWRNRRDTRSRRRLYRLPSHPRYWLHLGALPTKIAQIGNLKPYT